MISSITTNWLHWFDFVLVAAIGVGMYLKRHSNVLPEILGLIHWAFVFVISAALYRFPANWLANGLNMRPDVAAMIVYVVVVAAVYFLLGIKRKSLNRDVAKLEMFGRQEYRVAMFVGGLKTFVIMLVVMAFVHGRYTTEAEIHEFETFCKENFGNIQWPVLCTIRRDIFAESFAGKTADTYLGPLMVAAVAPSKEYEAAVLAKERTAKEVKIPARLLKGANTADGVVDELENSKGKQVWGVKENEGSANDAAHTSSDTAAASDKFLQINYRQLTLRGISGVGAKKMALINNQTLRQGDMDFVKVEKHKVKVYCQEIRDNSVLIRVDDKPEPIELVLNTAKIR